MKRMLKGLLALCLAAAFLSVSALAAAEVVTFCIYRGDTPLKADMYWESAELESVKIPYDFENDGDLQLSSELLTDRLYIPSDSELTGWKYWSVKGGNGGVDLSHYAEYKTDESLSAEDANEMYNLLEPIITKKYWFTQQPTEVAPSVITNADDKVSSYKWYSAERVIRDITDTDSETTEKPFSDGGISYENGRWSWNGVSPGGVGMNGERGITVALGKDDVLRIYPSAGNSFSDIYLNDARVLSSDVIRLDYIDGVYTYRAKGEEYVSLRVESQTGITANDAFTATVERYVSTEPIEGQTAAEFTGDAGEYFCVAEFEDGKYSAQSEVLDLTQEEKTYQKTITFRIANGKWKDGTKDDITYTIDLPNKTDKVDISGLIPTDMSADDGYENGKWYTSPPARLGGTSPALYLYSYTAIPPEEFAIIYLTDGSRRLNGGFDSYRLISKEIGYDFGESDVFEIGLEDFLKMFTKPEDSDLVGWNHWLAEIDRTKMVGPVGTVTGSSDDLTYRTTKKALTHAEYYNVFEPVFEARYKVTTQPTAASPKVVTDAEDKVGAYQWYNVSQKTYAVTDEASSTTIAGISYGLEYKNGKWRCIDGFDNPEADAPYALFLTELERGDVVTVKLPSPNANADMFLQETLPSYSMTNEGNGVYTFTAHKRMGPIFYLSRNGKAADVDGLTVTVKRNVTGSQVQGQTGAEFTGKGAGTYLCKISLEDGKYGLTSDPFTIAGSASTSGTGTTGTTGTSGGGGGFGGGGGGSGGGGGGSGGATKTDSTGTSTETDENSSSEKTEQETSGAAETGQWTNPYTDVTPGNWYYDAVKSAHMNGLMNGTSENSFSPSAAMDRAMLVTVLYRSEGLTDTESEQKPLPFTDVPDGMYYSDAVSWAYTNNIVNGVSENSFAPHSPMTREQLVTVLFRIAQGKAVVSGFPVADLSGYYDEAEISPWAYDAMQWAVAEGIISGTSQTTLSPKKTATRAEVAATLYRMQNK